MVNRTPARSYLISALKYLSFDGIESNQLLNINYLKDDKRKVVVERMN